MLLISWFFSNPKRSYPPKVNEDQSLSRSPKFVPAKLSTFEVFKVTHMCYKKFHCLFKKGKTWKRIIYVFLHHHNRCNLSPCHDSTCSVFFPASLLLTFFDVLAYAICLLIMSTHASRLLGTLNTYFLSFSQVSVCHLSLSRISANYISLGCRVFFSRWHMLFPFARLAYPMYLFFDNIRCFFVFFRNQYMVSVFSGIGITTSSLSFAFWTNRTNSINKGFLT